MGLRFGLWLQGPKVSGLGRRDKGCATSQHALHSALDSPLTSAEGSEIRVKGVGVMVEVHNSAGFYGSKILTIFRGELPRNI